MERNVWHWMFLVAEAADPGDALHEGARGQVGCFPLFSGVEALVSADRMDGRPVFVEEISSCTPGAPQGRPVVLAPAGETGREALQAVVDARNQDGGVRYALSERSDGWWIAPIREAALFDVPVDLDGARWPDLLSARASLLGQLALSRGVWVPPGGAPFGEEPGFAEVNTVSFTGRPLLEALRAVTAPHERTPTGFALLREPERTDALRRSQASLLRLQTPAR